MGGAAPGGSVGRWRDVPWQYAQWHRAGSAAWVPALQMATVQHTDQQINNTMATTTGCHRHRQWKKRMPVIATRALDRFNRCRTAPSIEPFRPTHGERTIHRPIGLLIAWMGKGQRTEQGQRTETLSLCDGIYPNVLDIAVYAGASKVSQYELY